MIWDCGVFGITFSWDVVLGLLGLRFLGLKCGSREKHLNIMRTKKKRKLIFFQNHLKLSTKIFSIL